MLKLGKEGRLQRFNFKKEYGLVNTAEKRFSAIHIRLKNQTEIRLERAL